MYAEGEDNFNDRAFFSNGQKVQNGNLNKILQLFVKVG